MKLIDKAGISICSLIFASAMGSLWLEGSGSGFETYVIICLSFMLCSNWFVALEL